MAVLPVIVLCLLQDPAEPLWGSWQWVRSSGGMLGLVREPAANEVQTLTFTRDHVAIYATNDSMTYTSNYQVYSDKTVFSAKPQPVVRIQGTKRILIVRHVTTDSLVLKEDSFDGWERVYVKIDKP